MQSETLELELLVSRIFLLRLAAHKSLVTNYSTVCKYGIEIANELKKQNITFCDICALWKDSRIKFEESYRHFFYFCEGTITLKDLTPEEYEQLSSLAYNCSVDTLLAMINSEVIKNSKILE